jgi:hypothetical protein
MKALFAVLALLAPALAQNAAQIKQELKTKETAAKQDADALFEVGRWAAEKGLAAEAKRIYQAVLKIRADHEGANVAIGNAQFEGKWLPAKEAEALRRKAEAAQYAAKGLVDVQGVWVEKEHVDDAKRGVFHHEKELVTKDEKVLLMRGHVRHPDTGELIDPKFQDKAAQHLHPIGNEGRWVDVTEADKFHTDAQRPWFVRSAYCTLGSNLPLAQIDTLRQEADKAVERVREAFGELPLKPIHRPVVLIADTTQKFQELGTVFSDGTDAAGAFLARDREDAQIRVPMLGNVRPSVTLSEGKHTPYYVRHAAAMAWLSGASEISGADLPLWLVEGAGSLARYFVNDSDAGWYGKQQMQRGGVKNLKAFFAGFHIDSAMEQADMLSHLYLAGLVVAYASSKQADPAAAAAWKAVKDALAVPGGASKVGPAVEKFAAAMVPLEAKLTAYLQDLLKLAPQ